MKSIIYTTSFYCKFCKKKITTHVYGDSGSDFPANKEEERDAIEWGKHFHWIDHHRRCAICGELVISGEQDEPESLNLMFNDEGLKIHSKYLSQTLEKAHKGQLLVVHNKCSKEYDNTIQIRKS